MQFQEFLNERLINRNKSIDAPIRKNNYKLPRNLNDAMKEEIKNLTYFPSVLNKIREVILVRKSQAIELFQRELFNVAESIAENADSLYRNNKSDIPKRFPTCKYVETDTQIDSSAIILDLSLFAKSHTLNENATFSDFAESLKARIFHQSSNYMRCDIIADRYFKDSLKENIRSIRGQGSRKHFSDETKIPGDFKSDFLTNSDNKNDLYIYLAEKFVETTSN